MFYKRYEKSDFIRDAVFENTLTENATALGRGGKQLEADHSKLDKYLAEELPTDTIERKESATRSIYRRVSNVGARATGAIRTSSRGSRDASGQFRKRTRSEDGEDSFNNSRCSTFWCYLSLSQFARIASGNRIGRMVWPVCSQTFTGLSD